MEQNPDTPQAIPLSELNRRAAGAINTAPGLRDQWITAEISSFRPSAGHLYIELLEKDSNGKPAARLTAQLWRYKAEILKKKRPPAQMRECLMTPGRHVMLRGDLTFHPVYSIGFTITDFNPEYSRDSTRVQAEIIAALQKEGIYDRNKQVPLPTVPQRIAVISSDTAAGYGDFCGQLASNPYGLKFYPVLFQATLQGPNTSPTVRRALERVAAHRDLFDAAVIIRGGGATSDLAAFDDMELARAVALFPLPVLVGIGHERDNTVLDYIAAVRCKTPTAVAEWLVARGADTLARITSAAKNIAAYVGSRTSGEKRNLDNMEQNIPFAARNALRTATARTERIAAGLPGLIRGRVESARQRLERATRWLQSNAPAKVARASARLDAVPDSLRRAIDVALRRERARLDALGEKADLLSPRSVLARGYSITRLEGRAVRRAAAVPPGSRISIELADGTLTSTTE